MGGMNDKLRQLFKDFSRYAKGGHVRRAWEIADAIEVEFAEIEKPEMPRYVYKGYPVFSCIVKDAIEMNNWAEAIVNISGEPVYVEYKDGEAVMSVMGDVAKVREVIREQLINLGVSQFKFL